MRPGLSSLILMFIITFAACMTGSRETCPPHDNPYGLEIVHCTNDYLQQVQSNPDMQLIDLEELIPDIMLDIRYATSDNFTGEIIYTAPKAYLRKPVAIALRQVQDSLAHLGLGLMVYDAYRPYAASLKFFEVYPDTNFVANPRNGSRHNRGCAVDLALVDLNTRQPLPMPTPFDEFSPKAHPEFMMLADTVLHNRSLLFGVMSHFGFTHYPTEWWHFDYQGWDSYPLTDLTFEELANSANTITHPK